jgi:hypothetical protein
MSGEYADEAHFFMTKLIVENFLFRQRRLQLETISNFPSSCFDFKHTKIVGNVSPMDLTEIAVDNRTPFLLDPKAKRWKEIAVRWSPKHRPFWRYFCLFKKSTANRL